jgi:rhamnosyltransferase
MHSIKKSIALGFVLYKAERTLVDRIKLASSLGFKCYIFDNSPTDQVFNKIFSDSVNCRYITAGKNVGLGFGISSVCGQAYSEGSDALLFFDQDTVFNASTLDFIDDFYTERKSLEGVYSSVVFNAKNIHATNEQYQFEIKDVLLTISSGSLFFLKRLKDINWHNQTYFVDCVDYEFCLNSNNHGLKVAECSNTPGFDHISEQADSEYYIFGKKRMMRKYPISRVRGTTTASLRLFLTAIKTCNPKFAYAIARSLGIYLYFQLLVRILNFFK